MKGKPLFDTINKEEFLADLGRMTDADVARKYKIFYKTVMVYRNKYGIKTFANERMPIKEEFAREVEIFPNTELAKKYGVGLRQISKWRKKLGVSNVWKCQLINKKQFKVDCKIIRWKQLCKKYGASWSVIKRWKKNMGLTTGKAEDRTITWSVDGNSCWVCTSHKLDDKGYPQCKGERLVAIRMWKNKNGEWPIDVVCTHSCDNKLCINPNHIIPSTMGNNQAEMAERNRSPWGNRCGARKLNSQEAKEIYALKNSGLSQRAVGKRYGISGSAVCAIWNDITWWRDNQGMVNFPVLLTKKIVGKKLTLREVESIRSMQGKLSSVNTAKVYRISQRMVMKIWKNLSWVGV